MNIQIPENNNNQNQSLQQDQNTPDSALLPIFAVKKRFLIRNKSHSDNNVSSEKEKTLSQPFSQINNRAENSSDVIHQSDYDSLMRLRANPKIEILPINSNDFTENRLPIKNSETRTSKFDKVPALHTRFQDDQYQKSQQRLQLPLRRSETYKKGQGGLKSHSASPSDRVENKRNSDHTNIEGQFDYIDQKNNLLTAQKQQVTKSVVRAHKVQSHFYSSRQLVRTHATGIGLRASSNPKQRKYANNILISHQYDEAQSYKSRDNSGSSQAGSRQGKRSSQKQSNNHLFDKSVTSQNNNNNWINQLQSARGLIEPPTPHILVDAFPPLIPEIVNQEQKIRNVRNFKAFLKETQKRKFGSEKDVKFMVQQKSLKILDDTDEEKETQKQKIKFDISQTKPEDLIQEDSSFVDKTRIKLKTQKKNLKNRRKSIAGLGVDLSALNESNPAKNNNIRRKNALKVANQPTKKITTEQDNKSENEDTEDLSSGDEQIKMFGQVRNSKYLLTPESTFRQMVDLTSFVVVIFVSLYVPFIFSFEVDGSIVLTDFEVLMDTFFLAEILLNFFTGYYDKGILILDRRRIFMSYVKGWFIVDILSSLPISYLDLILSDGAGAFSQARLLRIFKLFKYVRLLRLIRFLKASKFIQTFEDIIVNDYANLAIRFYKICVVVFFIGHWMACTFYAIGKSEFEANGVNWLSLEQLQDAGILESYINCLYWSFTNLCTVGYGDFHPTTTNERMISMVFMILSSALFAYIIGDIGRIVSSFNVLAAQFRERMIYVDRFLKQKQLPDELRSQVKRYLEYNWELKKLYKIEEEELMGLLNDNLKDRVMIYLNGKILQKIDILSKFPIEFISNLTLLFRQNTYNIDENVLIEGENGDEIFYIQTGKVNLIHRKSKTLICELNKEQYFGEVSFFSHLQRQVTIKTKDFTELLILKRDSFLQLANQVSLDALILYNRIKDSVSYNEKDLKMLCVKCYLCQVEGHISINCSKFQKYKGNLKRKQNEIKVFQREELNKSKRSHNIVLDQTNSVHHSEFLYQDKDNPKLVSLASRSNSLFDYNLSRSKSRQQESGHENSSQIFHSKIEEIAEEDNEETKNGSPISKKNASLIKHQKTSSKATKLTLAKIPNSPYDESRSLELTQDQFIHFDTPEKIDTPIMPKYHQPFHGSQSLTPQIEIAALNNSQNQKDVIQEALHEEEEEDRVEDEFRTDADMKSYQMKSQSGIQDSDEDDSDENAPMLTMRVKQVKSTKPPKKQNELTKMVGEKKRFNSKSNRQQLKQKQINQAQEEDTVRRSIQIKPFKEIKSILHTKQKSKEQLQSTSKLKNLSSNIIISDSEKDNFEKLILIKPNQKKQGSTFNNTFSINKSLESFYNNVMNDSNLLDPRVYKEKKHRQLKKSQTKQKQISSFDMFDKNTIVNKKTSNHDDKHQQEDENEKIFNNLRDHTLRKEQWKYNQDFAQIQKIGHIRQDSTQVQGIVPEIKISSATTLKKEKEIQTPIDETSSFQFKTEEQKEQQPQEQSYRRNHEQRSSNAFSQAGISQQQRDNNIIANNICYPIQMQNHYTFLEIHNYINQAAPVIQVTKTQGFQSQQTQQNSPRHQQFANFMPNTQPFNQTQEQYQTGLDINQFLNFDYDQGFNAIPSTNIQSSTYNHYPTFAESQRAQDVKIGQNVQALKLSKEIHSQGSNPNFKKNASIKDLGKSFLNPTHIQSHSRLSQQSVSNISNQSSHHNSKTRNLNQDQEKGENSMGRKLIDSSNKPFKTMNTLRHQPFGDDDDESDIDQQLAAYQSPGRVSFKASEQRYTKFSSNSILKSNLKRTSQIAVVQDEYDLENLEEASQNFEREAIVSFNDKSPKNQSFYSYLPSKSSKDQADS